MRITGIAEGISFLVLLGVAMPVKYLAGFPEGVLIVGWIHGLLFMAYLATAVHLKVDLGWSFGWLGGALLAAVVPFGPFVLDARLKRAQSSLAGSE